MISDFSLFFLKHFHLILSEAFSLRVIPCSHKQQHDVRKVTAFLGHRLRGWKCTARPRTWQKLENAFLTCMNVSQTSPYFSSPVLTEKQKLKQPHTHTHTHTKETRYCRQINSTCTLGWTWVSVIVHHHLILPPEPQNLFHTTLHCAILMLMKTPEPPLGTARRIADFPKDYADRLSVLSPRLASS